MDDRRFGAVRPSKVRRISSSRALGEHLDGDVVGNLLVLDEEAHEIEIRLRGGGKADLDFLEAHFGERVANMRILRSWPMGSMSDWLPSRRSTRAPDGGFGDRFGSASAGPAREFGR